MSSAINSLRITAPEYLAPHVAYIRSLDRFNDHAQELPSVLSLIAHRNQEAKASGLGDDSVVDEMAGLLRNYRRTLMAGGNSWNVERRSEVVKNLHGLLAQHKVQEDGIGYFDNWLDDYALHSLELAKATAQLVVA